MVESLKKSDLIKKVEEQSATIQLYIDQNITLQRALDDFKKRMNTQAAEILVFVDRVKQEKQEAEAFVIKLETELNDVWAFIQDVKDTLGEDGVVKSLLERYGLDKDEGKSGYIN